MTQPNKKQNISGWGNFPSANSNTYRPEKTSDLYAIIKDNKQTILAHGNGLSYGDASLNEENLIFTKRLDRFLSFDNKKGLLTVQAGVTLEEILDISIPKGWFLPVIPGTKKISIGGAVASNIHGKNHYKEGDIASHITNVKLILASGESINCSDKNNSDIFWATAGGMGMTGIIEEVTIKLKKISSLSLMAESKKVSNIFEMLEEFEKAKQTHEYMIGWIDHFAKDNNLGRGVFEKANHITEKQGGTALSEYSKPIAKISVPKFFPSFILNKYSMLLYNNLRFSKYKENWTSEIVNFDGFFHPLDNLNNWNRLYGKNGFFQYQFVIPDDKNSANNIKEILNLIQKRGEFSFLAVIKYHGKHKGLLSFPIKGYSVALDFPNNKNVRKLQHELNKKVTDLGGRIYLAKDAILKADLFKKMYKDTLSKWTKIVKKTDPKQKFNSLMCKRLKLKDYK